jgi:hypothetical protein
VFDVVRYRLVLRERDGSERTAEVMYRAGVIYGGDGTVPVELDGKVWRLVEERPADPPFNSTLVCEPEE